MFVPSLHSISRWIFPTSEDFFKKNQSLITALALGVFALYAYAKYPQTTLNIHEDSIMQHRDYSKLINLIQENDIFAKHLKNIWIVFPMLWVEYRHAASENNQLTQASNKNELHRRIEWLISENSFFFKELKNSLEKPANQLDLNEVETAKEDFFNNLSVLHEDYLLILNKNREINPNYGKIILDWNFRDLIYSE